MAQHTPGPWKHITVRGGWDGVGPVTGGTPICNLAENNPANASLIAAAPDFLHLAQEAIGVLRTLSGGEGDDADQLANRFAAVVAKAEGR